MSSVERQPNVLLISTDQHRGDCIGAEGRGVRTPGIDRIGARGLRFSNCITPHPMCQPARASILTGKLPYTHGVRDNGRDLDESFAPQGLAGLFDAAGYDTHFVGKAHLSSHQTFAPTGRPECYQSAADYPHDWTGPYFGFRDVRLMVRPHHHTRWAEPPEALHYERALDADGRGGERWALAAERVEPDFSHFQVWRSALGADWHTTAWTGKVASELIDAPRRRPFFAWVSFPDPHPPFVAPRPWSDRYDPRTVHIAPHRELDLDRRPWWHRAFLEGRAGERQELGFSANGVDWGSRGALEEQQLRDITAVYFGMIEAVDQQVATLLDLLEARGELDDTVVVFTSDHGEWLGDHGLLLKGPMLYDGLLRVPCVLQGPGVPAGRTLDAPVSTLDIRSTLAELCGLEAEPDNGRSWCELFDGSATRDFALNEWEVEERRSGVSLDLRTVRSRRYRLSTDRLSGAGELYDLQEDPHERRNLFDEPGSAAVRDEHLAMIAARPDDTIDASPRVGWH